MKLNVRLLLKVLEAKKECIEDLENYCKEHGSKEQSSFYRGRIDSYRDVIDLIKDTSLLDDVADIYEVGQ